MKRGIALLTILSALAAGCGGSDDRIIVAAGTTLVDSGFIERVFDEYPGGGRISVVGVSSREAFALGDAGSAELLITHLAEAEAEFLSGQPEALQEPVFASSFVLVGPNAVTAGTLVEAFREIAAAHSFVGRGDGSGTAAREREIWELAGIDPTLEPWYVETGQGMGFTLQVADQRKAYTLVEIGTFLAADPITLVPVPVDDEGLLVNPYRATLVPEAGEQARALFDWLTGSDATDAITAANFELFGEVLYAPDLEVQP